MTTLREAAQAVLDRWDSPRWEWHQGPTAALMADLRAALAELDLDRCPRCGGPADNGHDREVPPNPYYCTKCMAEPVQEPVAWAVYDIKHGGSKTLHWPEQHSPNGDPSQFKAVPLYSAPPQRKPLTEDRNFCPRCGKRSFPDTIHTCTPPSAICAASGCNYPEGECLGACR